MTNPRARRAPSLARAGSLTLTGCGFKGLYSAPLPGGADLGNHPYTVTAYFADVLDLVPQSAVKVNDVAVGKVTAISLSDCAVRHHGQDLVRQGQDRGQRLGRPAGQLARPSVQQTSLLGEKYVVADPAGRAPAADPAAGRLADRVRRHRRRRPRSSRCSARCRCCSTTAACSQIQNIATELNKALGSPERQQAVRSFITQLTTFTGTLDEQKNDITTALDRIDVLAATLNRQKQILTDALDTFPQALKVLSQERGQLVTLLSSLSNLGSVATRVINATQQDLVTSLKALDPVRHPAGRDRIRLPEGAAHHWAPSRSRWASPARSSRATTRTWTPC